MTYINDNMKVIQCSIYANSQVFWDWFLEEISQ